MPADALEGEHAGFRVAVGNGLLTLTLDRPEAGNAIASQAVPQLARVFAAVPGRSDVRAVLLRAEGPVFCAGGDVAAFAQTLSEPREERRASFRARLDRARVMVEAFLDLPVPIVAACQGGVAGAGVSYPLGADIALGEPSTRFVFAHQRVGLPPDAGLSYLLPRVVGPRKASELVLTAATVDATEALRIGLLSRVVDADTLQKEALAVAERLARAPAGAVRRARALLRASLDRSAGEQLAAERDAIADSAAEPDFEEGVRAFAERRRPVFGGA